MIEFYALVATFLVAAFTTVFVAPKVIKNSIDRNFVGRDVHKAERVYAAELGGIAVFFGFLLGTMTFIGINSIFLKLPLPVTEMLAGTLAVALIFVIGLIDDLYKLKWKTKIFLPAVAAIPLMAATVGSTAMNLPFVGSVEFGLVYTLILIPLGMTGAANASNMIAGYNGSETGIGLVTLFTLLIIAMNSGSLIAVVLLLAMIGALTAFLLFNWYPAKLFMGDSGTYQIGGLIATVCILGNMEKYGAILYLLYYINLIIFVWGVAIKAEHVKFAHPREDGRLDAPATFWKHYLPFAIIHYVHPTEKQMTAILVGLQTVVCAGVLALYFGGF